MVERDGQKKTEIWYQEDNKEFVDSWDQISEIDKNVKNQSAEILGWKLLSGSWEQRNSAGNIIAGWEQRPETEKSYIAPSAAHDPSPISAVVPSAPEPSNLSIAGPADAVNHPVKTGAAYPGFGSALTLSAPFPVPTARPDAPGFGAYLPVSAPIPLNVSEKPVENPKLQQNPPAREGESKDSSQAISTDPSEPIAKSENLTVSKTEPIKSVAATVSVLEPSAVPKKAIDSAANSVSVLTAEQAAIQNAELEKAFLFETREFELPAKAVVKKPITDPNVRPMNAESADSNVVSTKPPAEQKKPEKAVSLPQNQQIPSKKVTLPDKKPKGAAAPEKQNRHTGWQLVNGSWNYLTETSATETGWQFIDGKWQFIEETKK